MKHRHQPHARIARWLGEFFATTDARALCVAFGFMSASLAIVYNKLDALSVLTQQEHTHDAQIAQANADIRQMRSDLIDCRRFR